MTKLKTGDIYRCATRERSEEGRGEKKRSSGGLSKHEARLIRLSPVQLWWDSGYTLQEMNWSLCPSLLWAQGGG